MKYILYLIFVSLTFGRVNAQNPKNTETVNLGDINLYYEEYGEGEALILLHGWTQSSQFWKEYIEEYAKGYNVFAIDLRGHGKSSSLNSDFSIKRTANDILALMDYLGLDKVNAIGLSFGGLAILQLASLHPDRVKSMVLIGASHKYNGQDNKELSEQFKFKNLPLEYIDELKKIHFNGDDQIRGLFNPNLNYEINLTIENLKKIDIKTLIINGDKDELLGVKPAFELHENLPNSYLWIIPDMGHIAISNHNKIEFQRITNNFFQ
ncbi:MAG: alpha/beta hydrolase [Reichenbachiella sp.]